MKYIEKDKAYKIVLHYGSYAASAKIADLPSIDLVRCGECKFSDWYESVDGEQLCYCMEHGSTRHKETDYCNYGEREVQE
jgi:hypothetical protein